MEETYPDAEKVLKLALPIYCEFINSFIPDDPDAHYRPIDFTDDRENKHWGFTYLKLIMPDEDFQTLYVYRVSIGDEGGPATLYVWHNGQRITHMNHMFDTLIGNIAYSDPHDDKLTLNNKEDR